MYRILRVFALVALLASAAYGCADQATPFAPLSAGLDVRVGGPFLSLSQVEQTVHVLERTAPLAADVEASKVIGPAGGVLDVPAVGLRLTIPAGAVASPTRISVRAHAGSLVAYSFEPHGTSFAQVVTAEQSLEGTLAQGSDVQVSRRGYFSSPDEINWNSNRAVVTEVSLVQQDLSEGTVAFYLNHFSGYLVAID